MAEIWSSQYFGSWRRRRNRLNNTFTSLKGLKTEDSISISTMFKTAECIISMFRRVEAQKNVPILSVNARKVFDSILQNFGIGIVHRALQVNNNSLFDVFLQRVFGILRESFRENFRNGVREVVRRS